MKKLLLILFLVLVPFKVHAEEYLEIKIGPSVDKTEITSNSNFYLVDENLNKIHDIALKKLNVQLIDGKIVLKSDNTLISDNFPAKGEFKIASDESIKLKNNYRGFFHFEVENGKLNVINTVELEDYLKGVINNELNGSNPAEALKAQAVASRSFALSNKNKYIKRGFNLTDDTSSQVYRGQTSENKNTNAAVEETKGMVMSFDSKPISAIFGASSGGVIASAKDTWGAEYSYLSTKEDPYSTDYTWEFKISKEDLIKKLNAKYPLINIDNIVISETDSSGRAKTVEILGDKAYNIKAQELRSILGSTKFKSTLFTVVVSDEIVFSGKGYGHGVGMSQYGAVNMAKSGKNFEEILNFYFPGTELTK